MLPTYGQAFYIDDDGVVKVAGDAKSVTIAKATTISGTLTQSGAVTQTADIATTENVTATKTQTSTTPGTDRAVYGKQIVKDGTTSGNLVGVRGEVNLATLTSILGGSSMYGVQGKLVYDGTVNHADSRNCAVMAQLDVEHATLTAGYVDALWIDLGGTATGTLGNTQMIRITNTTAATPNAMLYAFGKASFLFDIASDEGSGYVVATAPSTLAGCLKVQIEGATKYIPYYTNPTGG